MVKLCLRPLPASDFKGTHSILAGFLPQGETEASHLSGIQPDLPVPEKHSEIVKRQCGADRPSLRIRHGKWHQEALHSRTSNLKTSADTNKPAAMGGVSDGGWVF